MLRQNVVRQPVWLAQHFTTPLAGFPSNSRPGRKLSCRGVVVHPSTKRGRSYYFDSPPWSPMFIPMPSSPLANWRAPTPFRGATIAVDGIIAAIIIRHHPSSSKIIHHHPSSIIIHHHPSSTIRHKMKTLKSHNSTPQPS